MGARRCTNASDSAMIADTSLMNPSVCTASCTSSTRPVFTTSSRIVRESSGVSVTGSTTVASMPCSASSSAASRERWTSTPVATIVRSPPVRRTAAFPIGVRTSPVRTSNDCL